MQSTDLLNGVEMLYGVTAYGMAQSLRGAQSECKIRLRLWDKFRNRLKMRRSTRRMVED